MESMTQSAQISSSQGFADGQNSAVKESKLSDSFLSTSPVSLIQSPQDKKVIVGTDKSSESVTTSLRFPSQPGSFSACNFGSEVGAAEEQPDSPIKTSPVSERIKALEALAAKKREPEYRDGSFHHFRDRHQEKSSSDIPKLPPSVTKPPIDIPKPSNIPKPVSDKSKPPSDIPKPLFDTPKPTIDISKPPTDIPKLPADGPVCSTEKIVSRGLKMEGSPVEESPESPFEVLGELRQGSEYEETAEWMKAHLPPVLDIDAAKSNKSISGVPQKDPDICFPEVPAAFASVPDAFMDSPVECPKQRNELIESQKQSESEEEFDIRFLPVAYVWDQQEKSNVQVSSNLESETPSTDAASEGLGSPSPSVPVCEFHSDAEQNVDHEKEASWGGDLDLPVVSEADSSGESEDTVIEEGVSASGSALSQSVNLPYLNDPPRAPDLSTNEKVVPPPKSERKLMQVPTINVIETDEPNYSDEEIENEPQLTEEEDFNIVNDTSKQTASQPEPQTQDVGPPKTRPLETEFIEGYSPPSSPVDSDVEYSPKHKVLESVSEVDNQQPLSKSQVQTDTFGEQSEKAQMISNRGQNTVMRDVDFPDNNDEWSDEDQDNDLKLKEESLSSQGSAFLDQCKVDEQSSAAGPEPHNESAVSVTGFMQDDIYDRQSFDYENDEPSLLDCSDGNKELNKAKKQVVFDPAQDIEEIPDLESDASFNDDEVLNNPADQASLDEYPQNPYSCFHNQTLSSANEKIIGSINKLPSLQQGSEVQPDSSSSVQDKESVSNKFDGESSFSEPPNSFVEFMRECLKSRQDEEPDEGLCSISSENQLSKTVLPTSQSPPRIVMDLDEERITVGALKELSSSQDETPLNLQTELPDQRDVDGSATSAHPSSFTLAPRSACSQSSSDFNSHSREVETVDEWMAEAYYLAEHVLTAILTHLSVKDLIHWRDPKKSGVVFGLSMLILLSLAAFSVISVVSYLLLALLIVTISFRIYKSVVQAVQKSNEGHPFKMLIDKDVSIPPETFRKHVDASLTYINRGLKQMSRLFLVEDLVDSLKLAVVMWLLTYVGAVFNGITLLILADILLFAVPPIYEKNKTQIDQYIDVARTQVNATVAKLQEKLPGAVKRSKAE